MRFRLTLTMLAVAMMTTVADAQPGGGFGGGFGGFGGTSKLALLRIEAVQKELELLDDQIEAIQKLQEELRPQFGGRGQAGRGQGGRGQGGRGNRRPGGAQPGSDRPARPDSSQLQEQQDIFFVQQRGQQGQGRPQLSDEEREARIAEFRKQQAERAKKEKEKLAEILLPHQLDRLNEIYIQVLGLRALQDEEIAKDLKITEKQQTEMRETQQKASEEIRSEMRAALQGVPREEMREKFAELREKMEASRKKSEEKVLAVLSKQQRDKFKKMQGEKFEMPENALRGGFGGGRGRGGQGGRPGGGQGGNRPQRPDA